MEFPDKGLFVKKPIAVKAERLKRAASVKTLEGTMHGYAGDWLITGIMGEKYICKDSIFRRSYVLYKE